MDRIETRTQLIDYIALSGLSYAIQRACVFGKVVVLGGFRSVPPSTRPGWIVIITSEHGRSWNVVVSPNEDTRTFRVWITDKIPVKEYLGVVRGEYSIYDGDIPNMMYMRRQTNG